MDWFRRLIGTHVHEWSPPKQRITTAVRTCPCGARLIHSLFGTFYYGPGA